MCLTRGKKIRESTKTVFIRNVVTIRVVNLFLSVVYKMIRFRGVLSRLLNFLIFTYDNINIATLYVINMCARLLCIGSLFSEKTFPYIYALRIQSEQVRATVGNVTRSDRFR